MTRFIIIATGDFHTSAGMITAGETLATIETDCELGELSGLLRTRHLIAVEAEGQAPPQVSQLKPRPESEDAAAEPVAQPVDEPSSVAAPAPAASSALTDLIDEKPAKLFAAVDPPIVTVADLAAWMAQGNHPSKIKGIGDVTEAEILAVTGLTLSR